MPRVLNSFKVRSGEKILDYRSGEKLNLSKIKSFFQTNYNVKKIWQGSRHVLGILTKDKMDFFLKLSTSEGISVVTKNEYNWNNYFNQYFPKNLPYLVPKNYESGTFENKYFYLITDYFKGKLLCDVDGTYKDSNSLVEYIPQIIELAELIQKMPGSDNDYKMRFISKVNMWFSDIPVNVSKKFKIKMLLDIIEKGVDDLLSRPRHGDFTPWHLIKLPDQRLGLIDGEHFLTNGVEGYDICYFIQRVFSVLENPDLAKRIYIKLIDKGYDKNKLQIVLASRAIGGFLDESLREKPDYKSASNFKDWVLGR